MAESELNEYMDKIEEEVIKEDNGFVQKIMSSEDEIVEKIAESSKKIEVRIKDSNENEILNEREPLRSLLNFFVKNKEKVNYSFDEFENGVIRLFETEEEELVDGLHRVADTFSKHVALDFFLHESTAASFILNSGKPVMVFFVYPEQGESEDIIKKIPGYIIDFEKVEIRAVNVKESSGMDEIFKVGMETPIVVLYKLDGDEIKEIARLSAGQVTEESIVKMSNLEV